MPGPDPQNSPFVTAYCERGPRAAIAYCVDLKNLGPNGEPHESFVIETENGGQDWVPAPLVRSLWSRLRFWGYPVWPPERISEIRCTNRELILLFEDEEVVYEHGGESV